VIHEGRHNELIELRKVALLHDLGVEFPHLGLVVVPHHDVLSLIAHKICRSRDLAGIGSADAVVAGHRDNRGDIPGAQNALPQPSGALGTEGRLF
jgi:hypothetical protein